MTHSEKLTSMVEFLEKKSVLRSKRWLYYCQVLRLHWQLSQTV